MAREIPLARHAWDVLSPLEPNADTIHIERHLPNQFQLLPPKSESGMSFQGPFSPTSPQSTETDALSVTYSQPGLTSETTNQSTSTIQTPVTPVSANFSRQTRNNSLVSIDETLHSETVNIPDTVVESKYEQEPVRPPAQTRRDTFTSTKTSGTASVIRKQYSPSSPPPEKSKSRFFKFTAPKKTAPSVRSADTSSLSSTTLEAQKLEEVPLKNLANAPKINSKGKGSKNINVYLSYNSTYALFWTQVAIHMWDVGTSPPTIKKVISTESTCLLAAVTKRYLVYVIGNRDQKLTVGCNSPK